MKKIGIIGTGPVAQALANGFIKHGDAVMIGSRDGSKGGDWKQSAGPQAHTGTMSEAAAFGDLLVLTVKGEVAADALRLAGAENIGNKVVIDTTNPIDHSKSPVNGVLPLFTDRNDSLMEQLQRAFPSARFVKAFSCVGNAFMVNPTFPQGKPTMFICGNDDAAKGDVKGILDAFGWESEDMGKVESARAIEPLVSLWCAPGFIRNQWTHAFALFKMK